MFQVTQRGESHYACQSLTWPWHSLSSTQLIIHMLFPQAGLPQTKVLKRCLPLMKSTAWFTFIFLGKTHRTKGCGGGRTVVSRLYIASWMLPLTAKASTCPFSYCVYLEILDIKMNNIFHYVRNTKIYNKITSALDWHVLSLTIQRKF